MVLRLPFAEAFNNAYRLSVCVRACAQARVTRQRRRRRGEVGILVATRKDEEHFGRADTVTPRCRQPRTSFATTKATELFGSGKIFRSVVRCCPTAERSKDSPARVYPQKAASGGERALAPPTARRESSAAVAGKKIWQQRDAQRKSRGPRF